MAITQIRCRIDSPGHVKLTGPAYNVFHVFTGSAPAVGDINAALVDFKTFYDAVGSYFKTGTVVTVGERCSQVDVTPNTVIPATPLASTTAGGTNAAPVEVAACVSWRSILAGARYRGRTYLGPLSTSVLATGGEFIAAYVTAVQNAATTLIANLQANTVPTSLHIYSRKYHTSTLVGTAFVDNEPDTQRRRGL